MSAALFASDTGVLLVVKPPEGSTLRPGILTVEGLKGQTSVANVVITSFSMQAAVAMQSTPTIGGPEYVCGFGDRMNDISVGIVVYPRGCTEQANGFLDAWKYYYENRVQPTKTKPVKLTFCGLTIKGLIREFGTVSEASQGTAVIQAKLRLMGWVDKTTLNSNTASASTSSSTPSNTDAATAAEWDEYNVSHGFQTDNWTSLTSQSGASPQPQAKYALSANGADTAKIFKSVVSSDQAEKPQKYTTAKQAIPR